MNKRESFTNRLGFILACIGSAVGMGNIWMFPTRVSLYGGGSYLIPYFIFVVLIASTGVIGFTLPMDVIADGVKKLSGMLKSDVQSAQDAAEAILTTDTHPKQIAYETTIGGKTVTFGAMCKGSGMIHPNMGTMLGFIMTDAAISKNLLDKALKGSIEDTFNMVSVDGDTSTNDTVLVMANGMAGNPEITESGSCQPLRYTGSFLEERENKYH